MSTNIIPAVQKTYSSATVKFYVDERGRAAAKVKGSIPFRKLGDFYDDFESYGSRLKAANRQPVESHATTLFNTFVDAHRASQGVA